MDRVVVDAMPFPVSSSFMTATTGIKKATVIVRAALTESSGAAGEHERRVRFWLDPPEEILLQLQPKG